MGCEISHCSGPVKNGMIENEIILIFSTNHLLLQKFLEDRLCLKDALAVLLKIEEGHLHIPNDTKNKEIFGIVDPKKTLTTPSKM